MKKSYSSLNLLQEKLTGLTEPKGFFGFIFSNRKHLTITLPYYDFLRGEVFTQDLHDLGEEGVPAQFGLGDLIYTLFDDFLTQIKRGMGSNEQIAQYLLAGYNRHFNVSKIEKRVMKSITTNLFQFETIEEKEIEKPTEKNKMAYLPIYMRRSEIMRAEILIHDLEPYLNDIELSVEQVIAIVYLDFIERVKNEGNSIKVQKTILNHLKSY